MTSRFWFFVISVVKLKKREKVKGIGIIVNGFQPHLHWIEIEYYFYCVYAFISSFMAFPFVFSISTISLNPFDKRGLNMQAIKFDEAKNE